MLRLIGLRVNGQNSMFAMMLIGLRDADQRISGQLNVGLYVTSVRMVCTYVLYV